MDTKAFEMSPVSEFWSITLTVSVRKCVYVKGLDTSAAACNQESCNNNYKLQQKFAITFLKLSLGIPCVSKEFFVFYETFLH